ncbi:hypothetical protein [Cetobacterium sp.]|uniref:hypothetical protein n=1 Tax=Cetobacterium sp. TaxID=2071632 RepID=UPI002FC8E2F3
MRVKNSKSLALERSMNLQCHIMTFEEALRNAEVIDNLDDQRREKMFGLMKWRDDMNIHFSKRLEHILKIDNLGNLKNELEKHKTDKNEFDLKFKERSKIIKEDELYYEKLDDELRTYLIDYAVKCREELRELNSKTEMKLIKENKKRQVCTTHQFSSRNIIVYAS